MGVRSIDGKTLKMLLAAAEAPVLIDVREPEEFARGRIDGAENIPLTELSAGLSATPMNKQVIFVCQSGVRSLQAANFAASIGYKDVKNLEGGINAFDAAG